MVLWITNIDVNEAMMKQFSRLMVIGAFLASGTVSAAPIDLSTAYRKALDYDAKLRVARADNMIFREEIGKSRSKLRPNIRWSGSRGRSSTQHGFQGRFTPVDYYNTINYGVTVRQPLLNLSSIAEYQQSKAIASKSDAELQSEEVGLIVRVTEAYCNALFAEDNLSFSQAHTRAMLEQLRQARRRFDNGYGTITEINEAQASYDIALAEGVDIVSSVEFSRRELEDLIGIYPDELSRLDPSRLALQNPQPKGVEEWIAMALMSNPALAAARQEIQIAKHEIDKQRWARYPTIDLVGSKSYSESENNYSIGSTYNTYSISLQLSVPTYTGGFASAAIRQAHAKRLKSVEDLSSKERAVESEIRKYYNGVVTTIAQIHAYEQAVKSGEIVLIGTKKGFGAGIRSNVDVLDAEWKLFTSRRDLAKLRYQYILNSLLLKQRAGILSEKEIEQFNGSLIRG
ncbi:MAG: TolC family outer membrane protein [Chlorobiaceae bacterium]|nr:TolC family outer membrane protein [Chlorobiaceae bacterium]